MINFIVQMKLNKFAFIWYIYIENHLEIIL